ncbi:MAG: DUF4157 domain-containing protein [Cyanobacteria bacterium CRU_2_1]|nr:DUF4157 domain-containing protein [Cyanobacteria bacterium CRU_2_1]
MAVFKRSRKAPSLTEESEPFFKKTGHPAFFSSVAVNPIQAKLTMGKPGDGFEREADATADAIVNHHQPPHVQQQDELIQRQPTEEEEPIQTQSEPLMEDKEEAIQTKPELQLQMPDEEQMEEVQTKLESGGQTQRSPLVSQLQQTQGRGNPLPRKTRSAMESAFGRDLSDVQIHTDRESVQMNRELNAQAFTHGKDIYFNQGKFDPESSMGKHLLAHELTHVMQQTQQEQ